MVSKAEALAFVGNTKPQDIMVRMYLDGVGQKEIGEQFGITQSAVSYWVKKLGVDYRSEAAPRTTVSVGDEIARLYKEGNTYREIQSKLSVTSDTINKILKSKNIEPRDKGHAGFPDAVRNEAIRLYADGELSAADVGKQLGVSEPVVIRWVRSGGITRSPSDRMTVRNQQKGDFIRGISVRYSSSKTGESSIASSSYEYVRMLQLESDPNVSYWSKKTDRVKWGDGRTYIPDFYIEYSDGRKVVEEVKAYWAIDRDDVVAKASAAREFFGERGIDYRIVSEKDLGFDELRNFDYESIPGITKKQIDQIVRGIEKSRQEIEGESSLFQPSPLTPLPTGDGAAKGMFKLLSDGRRYVRAGTGADVSTAIHEVFGHGFLYDLFDMAQHDAGSAADLKTVVDWNNRAGLDVDYADFGFEARTADLPAGWAAEERGGLIEVYDERGARLYAVAVS